MIEITITECQTGGAVIRHTAKTTDVAEALDRALRKYGKGKCFVRDRSLSVGANALEGSQYGQIGNRVPNGVSLNTGRVRINATLIP